MRRDTKRLRADSQCSNQTAQMRRLIWVFAVCTWFCSAPANYRTKSAWHLSARGPLNVPLDLTGLINNKTFCTNVIFVYAACWKLAWCKPAVYRLSLVWLRLDWTLTASHLFWPPQDKTNKMTRAPSEDSDQPGHPPSQIRVFAVRMKKPWVLTCTLSAQWRLIRLSGCPGWSVSSHGAHVILLVLLCGGSFIFVGSFRQSSANLWFRSESCMTRDPEWTWHDHSLKF